MREGELSGTVVPVVSRDSLANPHALDSFVDFARRRAGAATR